MATRIPEILSWYGSDNPGTLTNLARLLNHGRLAGTGKLVILPVDQGLEQMGAHIIKVKLPDAHLEQAAAAKVYDQTNIPIATLAERVRHIFSAVSMGGEW
jgi:DhnA family fructose-bisphosphate aldolase class Ia